MDGKKVYKSMYEWLNMWAEQYGGHEALCDNKGSYSYESLNTSVKNLSIGFADMGLRKSDKVILQLDNCNEFVIVCFALMSMGVIPILAVPGLRVNDLDIIAKKANPVMYIRPDEYMGFIYAETGRKLQIMNPSIKYVLGTSDINKMMEQSNNSAVEIEQPKAEGIGLILLSGGTTNIPKLIPVTHYAFAYHASEAGKTCRFNRETIYMAVMPVEHKLTLFSPGIMGTLFCGGKVVMCSDSSCETAFSLIEEEQVNVVSLVPSVAKMWVEDLEWDDSYDFSSLKYCMLGGAKLEETDARKIMDSLNCDIIQGYGMSEGFLSLSTWKDSAYERINYQGKPMSDEDQLFPAKVLSMFITTPGVAASGATNFRIMFSTYVLQGSFMIAVTLFQSLGKANKATWLVLFRQIILFIPLCVLLPMIGGMGIRGVWLAIALTDAILVVITISMMISEFRKMPSTVMAKR